MDPSRPIVYRSTTLNDAAGGAGGNLPIVGMRVSRASYGEVSVHGYIEKNALKDGMSASDVFMGLRRVSLTGEVYGADKGELFDRLALLRYICTPTTAYGTLPEERGYHPMVFEVPTKKLGDWPTGYIQQSIRCRPSAQPAWSVTLESLDADTPRGFSIPVELAFDAKDPLIYDPTQSVYTMSGTSGSGTMRNRGNYDSPLHFLLRRQAADTAEAQFNFVGMGANMTVIIPADVVDRNVIVDTTNRVVYLLKNGVYAVDMSLIDIEEDSGYVWPAVPPTEESESPPSYSWTATGSLLLGSEATFYQAWA